MYAIRSYYAIGHKICLKPLEVGDTVIKYGVDIGKVVAPIGAGQSYNFV